MIATVAIDDAIFAEAAAVLHTTDPAQVIHKALEAVARPRAAQLQPPGLGDTKTDPDLPPPSMTREEAYRYLATIGGSMPELEMPRRRRVEDYP